MAIDDAELADSTAAATEQQNKTLASADQSLSNDQTESDAVRKTPFSIPALSTTIPPVPTLTSDQEAKYTELLQSVRTWVSKENLPEHEQCWLTRECLLRYLRASSWNVAMARKRLEATITWRRSYGVDSKLTAEYISIENETGKQWIVGYDNAGRTCLYLLPQYQNTARTERQIQHLVFMLERCIDLTPPGQESLAILINFADTRTGQSASIAQGRETLSILQNHYPERLGRAMLSNLPWHISAFMKIILPFVDPVTKAKLVINQSMSDHIPSEQLPTFYGGTLEFKYEHDIYWPALTQSAAQRREKQFERWVKGGKHIGELEGYLKGGLDFGIDRKGDSKDEKTDDKKDAQPVVGKDAKREVQATTGIEEESSTGVDSTKPDKESTGRLDDMTETVVERDGDIFEDAVEVVEKLTI